MMMFPEIREFPKHKKSQLKTLIQHKNAHFISWNRNKPLYICVRTPPQISAFIKCAYSGVSAWSTFATAAALKQPLSTK